MLNNQRKNVKNKNERSEVDVLSGFSVYHDDKNRTIYYNRLNHRGYVIKPRDFTTFRTFSKRLFAALAVIVLMFSFENTFNTMPYIPIGVGVLVYAVMQFKFSSFLHHVSRWSLTSIRKGLRADPDPVCHADEEPAAQSAAVHLARGIDRLSYADQPGVHDADPGARHRVCRLCSIPVSDPDRCRLL